MKESFRMKTLNQFFDENGAQKHMAYRNLYEKLFSPIRDEPITFLEIGVSDGGSIRAWSDYFSCAKIFGIDIKFPASPASPNVNLNLGRAIVIIGRQEDKSFLRRVLELTGQLDVVIDDGVHKSACQQASFEVLFPCVKVGGLYIIEDLWVAHETADFIESKELDCFFIEESGYKRDGCIIRKH